MMPLMERILGVVIDLPSNTAIFLLLSEIQRAKGSGLSPWPARLTTPPPRLADFGYSNEMFEKDTVIKLQQFIYIFRFY